MARLLITLVFTAFLLFVVTESKKENDAKKDKKEKNEAAEKWKKKDIRDYNDADMERLFEQWEEADEDELEEDELPEWKKEPPKVDLTKLDPNDPEGFLKLSKKGRTLMMFATVSGNPTEEETEKISLLWHSSLFNAHIETQRYVVGSNRVLFMLTDGAKAWEIRDYLVKQDRCEEVSIEGQTYPGAGATQADDSKENQKKPKSPKKDDEKKPKSSKKDDEKKPKSPGKEDEKKSKSPKKDDEKKPKSSKKDDEKKPKSPQKDDEKKPKSSKKDDEKEEL